MTALLLYRPVPIAAPWVVFVFTLVCAGVLAYVAWAGDQARVTAKRVVLACVLAGALAAFSAYSARHALPVRATHGDAVIGDGCSDWWSWSIFCLI